MATDDHVAQVERIIDYKFRSKNHLQRALTAAGAEDENHDGNRKLAHIGDTSIRYTLSLVAYRVLPSRSQITNLETALVSISEKASIAERTGIKQCIKYSARKGGKSEKVLALAISAILGAVRIDSGELVSPWRVALHLGLVSGSWNDKLNSLDEIGLDPSIYLSSTHAASREITSPAPLSPNSGEDCDLDALFREGQPEPPSRSPKDMHCVGNEILDISTSPFIPEDDRWYNTLYLSFLGGGSSDAASFSSILGKTSSATQGHNARSSGIESADEEEFTVASPRKRKARGPVHGGKPANTPRKKLTPGNRSIWKFLAAEAERCSFYQYPLAETTYFRPDIQKSLIEIGTYADALSSFLLYIASPESIVVLRQILETARKKQSLPTSSPLPLEQSKKSRFNSIERLGDESIWCRFLRAVHVLELYKACSDTGVSDGFVTPMTVSFQPQKRRPGNPLHAAESQIVREMMAEIFPELSPGTESYILKQKSMKNIRRFGHRLSILVESFGPGILGLMMGDDLSRVAVSEMTYVSHLGIQLDSIDRFSRILKPTDEEFREFITILERSQSNFLSTFALAAQNLLDPVICSALPPFPFLIESKEPETILKYPKGSKGLLEQVA